jgi:hypothetical protein
MTRQSALLLLGVLLCAPLFAQKTFQAPKLDQIPSLDGAMDEPCWQKAGMTEDFTTSTPVFGQQPAHPISVRMFYADDALYIGATFKTDHLRDDGSARDAFAGDWFSVSFDTWNDDQHAFLFVVTAGGAQIERQVAGPNAETNWDAVWQSAVARRADGWSVEMRIPFTALRFPKVNVQNWGIQFTRYDINKGEVCTWNPQNPLIGDAVLQYGNLEGLEDIHQAQRRRLSAYSENQYYRQTKDVLDRNDKFLDFNLGIDAQVGIGSNATLDFTLLPMSELNIDLRSNHLNPATTFDFLNGNAVVNPRQLNAESALLFGRSEISWQQPQLSLDYLAKRLGKLGPETSITKRQEAKVLNVARFSTRTRRNFGFGVYNAVLGPTGVVLRNGAGNAEEKRLLQPLSNYTMFTAEKVLRNNSWINLSNATLLAGPQYRTNISAADIRLRDRSNKYEIAGNGQLSFRETTPDTASINYQYRVSVAKANGAWRWRVGHNVYSETMALLTSSYYADRDYEVLSTNSDASVGYRDVKPGRRYLNRSAYLTARKFRTDPVDFTAFADVLTHRFQRWSAQVQSNLVGTTARYYINGRDFLERRVSPLVDTRVSFQSDARKRFYFNADARYQRNTQGETAYSSLGFVPVWVINRQFSLRSENTVNYGQRYLNVLNDGTAEYLFIQFNGLSIIHTMEINWYAGSRFRMWAQGRLNTFRYVDQHVVRLLPDRSLAPYDYPFTHNSNVANWTATVGLQYLFAPGSQLRFSHQFKGQHYDMPPATFPGIYAPNGLKEMQTTLSIILLIDPPNKRNFVGHE